MGRGDLVPRIITNFAARIRYREGGPFGRAWPVNLSETGVCLRIIRETPVGQTVQLQINLDQQTAAMEVSGKIVWVRQDTINNVY